MAKKKNERLDPDSYENIGMIESSLQLDTLELKRMKWRGKFTVESILPRTYHRYNVILELDEQPYRDRIDDLQKNFDASLFSADPKAMKAHKKQVGDIEDELERLQNDCERIEFGAVVEELKYKDSDTKLTLRIPDDVIEPINRQKVRLDLYKVSLIPQLTEDEKPKASKG